jgi:hypothetical protein
MAILIHKELLFNEANVFVNIPPVFAILKCSICQNGAFTIVRSVVSTFSIYDGLIYLSISNLTRFYT